MGPHGLLGVIALVLGLTGFVRLADAAGRADPAHRFLYLSIQLFVLQSGAVLPPLPWELEVARFLAPAVAGYTAISALAVLFREQLQRLRTLRLQDHVVVCGLGRKGALLRPLAPGSRDPCGGHRGRRRERPDRGHPGQRFDGARR